MHPIDRLRLQFATGSSKPGNPKPKPNRKKPTHTKAQPLRPPLAAKVHQVQPIRDDSANATDLWFDWETYSEIDIKKCGLDNYARHPSTKPILIAFAFDDKPTQLVDLTVSPIPAFLLDAFRSSRIRKIAWNVPFELAICKHCLNIDIPLSDVFDPSALARKLTFSGKLSLACDAAGLSQEQGKDKAGNRLIKMFCSPNKHTATQIKKGEPAVFRRMPAHNPEEWQHFCDYNIRDVDAMRTVTKLLVSLSPWTREDHETWMLDQEINHRGLPVDLTYVTHADRLIRLNDARTLQQLKELTKCPNPNSVAQLKKFCDEQGFPIHSLAADEIEMLLSTREEAGLPAPVAEMMKLRQMLSGAGPKKLTAIQGFVSEDLRLRNQHVFHAGRTGRWAGREVQTQNLPKPKPEYEERIPEFTELIRRGCLPNDVSPSDAITGTIRSSFRAPDGYKFVISDFSSIENRVLAWFAGCEGMLDVFKQNLDPYKAFAVLVYCKPYEEITKAERTSCKPPVLGAGFGMSAATLQAYASSMGITLTLERAEELINTFRREYWEVPQFWRHLEGAVKTAISLNEIVEYEVSSSATLIIDATDDRSMKIVLPSGRAMFYREARIRDTMTSWGEMRPTIVYKEANSSGKPTARLYGELKGFTATHGSKVCENVVQAAARDILADAMLAASKAGYKIVAHCHDEIVIESPDETAEADKEGLEKLMSVSPAWATDLPLAAKAVVSQIYIK